MGGMSEYAFSTKMRDTLITLAEAVVQRLRPADRYGVVQTIDTANHKCTVLMNGDPVPVTVNLGALMPMSTGQTVRVAGVSGDKYVADIFGGAYLDYVTSPRLRLTAGNDLSPTSTLHPFQVGLDSGDNVGIDINEIMARTNGAVNPAGLWLQAEGAGVNIGGATGADDATDEVRVGRSSGLRTILNYNQLRALLNGVASTLYFQFTGGDVNICGNSSTGGIISPGTMRVKSVNQTTNQANMTSQTATAGANVCGFSFVCPPSGQVLLEVAAYFDVTTTNEELWVWGEIRSGSTVASGTIQGSTHGKTDNGPLLVGEAQNGTGNYFISSGFTLVTGLTPGTTYNAAVFYALGTATGGSANVYSRRITMIPSM